MCGIAGITGEQQLRSASNDEEVLGWLSHRGPDAKQVLRRTRATLFHTRLSIIDTTAASSQPFAYEEHQDALVFNGEIFNYRELAGGFSDLRTNGDVEVLYRLLQDKGEAALPLLNGFFALAYYGSDGSVLLARDRFGEKPLYYTFENGELAFSSELKSLLALTDQPRALNGRQIYTYFRLNFCAGRETIFDGVYRLLPGQLLKFSGGQIALSQWYSIQSAPPAGNLFTLLDDAVKLRLRADVPVGTFLSGGLDSSVVSALAARHHGDIQAFSIGFMDEPYLDETNYAALVAKHIGARHHVFRLREEDFLTHLDKFLAGIDEPFADSSAFNMYMLSMFTARHVKVALTGDGADELFKGYRKHRALLLAGLPVIGAAAKGVAAIMRPLGSSRAGKASDIARKIGKLAALRREHKDQRTEFLASVSSHKETEMLLQFDCERKYFDQLFAGNDLLPGFSAGDQFDVAHVLSDDMLVKADRFSMRHGLELRSPFLDHRVAEHALRLPLSAKISLTAQKIPIRNTFGHLLPPEILRRKKKGFEVPIQRWLAGKLAGKVDQQWLNQSAMMQDGIFDPLEVKKLRQQMHSKYPGDSPARLWAIIVFTQWMNNFGSLIMRKNGQPVIV